MRIWPGAKNHASENALDKAGRFYNVNAVRAPLWHETHSRITSSTLFYNAVNKTTLFLQTTTTSEVPTWS